MTQTAWWARQGFQTEQAQWQSPQGRYISHEELFQRHGFIKRTEPAKPTLAPPTSCYPEEWYHRNVWGLKP